MDQQSFFQAWNHLELTPDARRTFDAQRADRAKQTGIDDATSRDPELFARAKRVSLTGGGGLSSSAAPSGGVSPAAARTA